ncbi:hypothetical protein SCUCBS95973_001419 [Sporothrix curviconia]|uniref:Acyl-CoA thioesterase II n=1 Tax=Sporothrix curviconia TaxID=1260050 RepID=A0ABP0AYG6_9PEZI
MEFPKQDFAPTMAEQLAVKPVGSDGCLFESVHCPLRMGNAAPIAYGGSTLGMAVTAAAHTVQPTHKLYSVLGHFLGPAGTASPVRVRVDRTRDTKSFATRRVQVLQDQNGKERVCLDLLMDFHVVEAAYYQYSTPPVQPLDAAPPAACLSWEQQIADHLANKTIGRTVAALAVKTFAPLHNFFENRDMPQGISAQNLAGVIKKVATTQDDLPITSKWSGVWLRQRNRDSQEQESDAAQWASLAFVMDAALSFLPLAYDHRFLDDAGACSSLDLALRIFQPNVDLRKWHLRQSMTGTADAGRTYSENVLWDGEGRMVASMTQQSILRAPGPKM